MQYFLDEMAILKTAKSYQKIKPSNTPTQNLRVYFSPVEHIYLEHIDWVVNSVYFLGSGLRFQEKNSKAKRAYPKKCHTVPMQYA